MGVLGNYITFDTVGDSIFSEDFAMWIPHNRLKRNDGTTDTVGWF